MHFWAIVVYASVILVLHKSADCVLYVILSTIELIRTSAEEYKLCNGATIKN